MSKTTILLDFGSGPSTVVLPATVYIRAVSVFASNNKLILPAPAPVPLNAAGQGSVALDDGVVWGFVVSVPSYRGTEEFRFVHASDVNVQYKDLLAVSAPPPGEAGVPEWVSAVIAAARASEEDASAAALSAENAGLSAETAAESLASSQAVQADLEQLLDSVVLTDGTGKVDESVLPSRLSAISLAKTIKDATPSTPEAVSAEPVGLSTKTKAELSATIADSVAAGVTGKANVARLPTLPAAASSGERPYDATRNLYNFKPSQLMKARSAIGKAIGGTGLAKIACLGTSIAAGQGALAGSTSYPVRLRQLLAASGIPIGGTGIVLCHQGDTPADARWAFPSGPWAKFNPGSTDRTMLYYSNAGGAQAVFTSDLAGTIVELFYSNSSGPFTVSIDGAAAVTVTPSGAAMIGTYQVTGLADTVHAVAITRVSGSVYLAGAQVRRASGLLVSNIGVGGARISDLNFAAQPYVAHQFVRDVIAPDLIIFNAMTNEAYTGVTAAKFKTDLTAILTTFSGAGIPVLLVGEIPAGGTTSGGAAMDLTAYRTALYEVARERDLPLLDLFERWGSYAAANGAGLMADVFHPNAAGYGDYAAAVRSALT